MQRFSIRLIVAAATFFVGLTTAQVPNVFRFDATSSSIAEREVLGVEREYKEAHVARDAAALSRILADDFALNYHRGRFTTKAERLALIESPDFKFESINTRHVKVQVNEDRALVSGQAVVEGWYKGREFSSPPYRFMRVYEKRQGQWQVVAVHISHVGWR